MPVSRTPSWVPEQRRSDEINWYRVEIITQLFFFFFEVTCINAPPQTWFVLFRFPISENQKNRVLYFVDVFKKNNPISNLLKPLESPNLTCFITWVSKIGYLSLTEFKDGYYILLNFLLIQLGPTGLPKPRLAPRRPIKHRSSGRVDP